MAVIPVLPSPAMLLRRMSASLDSPRITVSRNAADPMLRVRVETGRGSLVVQLANAPDDTAEIQWTQNGVPLAGQTSPLLHLAALTADDTDIYYALLTLAGGTVRSQPFLLVVVAGIPLLNWSARGLVTPEHPLIGGFVIGRPAGPLASKRYLFRAVGPTLARLGITAPLGHPTVELVRRGAKWDGWESVAAGSAALQDAQKRVGAFALDDGAPEFVGIGRLPPGPCTVIVRGGPDERGEVLLDLYELPD